MGPRVSGNLSLPTTAGEFETRNTRIGGRRPATWTGTDARCSRENRGIRHGRESAGMAPRLENSTSVNSQQKMTETVSESNDRLTQKRALSAIKMCTHRGFFGSS